MLEDYHQAIVHSQYENLIDCIESEEWSNILPHRDGARIYIQWQLMRSDDYPYISRIDMSRYPVDPYWVGFIDPDLPPERWSNATDSDPRFWPWSPMPGLHGSFNIAFPGFFRTFWCRECNFAFFNYHGDHRWSPVDWPLNRVVAHLREAVTKAEPPNKWRPIQQQVLLATAAANGITLPPDAGLGRK